ADTGRFDFHARTDTAIDERLDRFADVGFDADRRCAFRGFLIGDLGALQEHKRESISQPPQISAASILPHQPARSVEFGSGRMSSGSASASVPSATMIAVAKDCVSSSVPSGRRFQSHVTLYFGNSVFCTMRISGAGFT